jgi:hypothetical protein
MDLRKDIYFYADLASFPAIGAANLLYVDKSSGFIYTWDGSSYAASGAGGLKYGGLWNANTNNPTITSGVGDNGEYYIVGTAGTTSIDGISDWGVGDWIIFGGSAWQKIDNSEVSSSGRFGISDTSGVYTYYATLTLAMTAASAGQTIELFADYTESSVTAITLKNGVNINGNGHTYNYTAATGDTFIDNGVAVVCTINNLNISRTNYTSGSVYVQSSSSSDTDWNGSKINVTAASGNALNIVGKIRNIWAKVTGNGNVIYAQLYSGAQFFNCYAESTGSGTAFNVLNASVFNCTGISSSGTGYTSYLSRAYNSLFYSTSSTAVREGYEIYNCAVVSISGIACDRTSTFGCTIISTSGVGCQNQNHVHENAIIKSSSNAAVTFIANIYNSTISTDTSSITSGLATIANYYNCSLRTNWNNVNGHLLTSAYATSCELVNNFMQVANSSAYILTSAAASTVKYANNSYKGATTPINTAVVTQTIVNTQDNQGNILL